MPRPKTDRTGRTLPSRLGVFTLAAAALAAGYFAARPAPSGALAAEPTAALTVAAASTLSADAWQLASDGKIDDLWRRIDELAANSASDPHITRLRKDVTLHVEHETNRRLETQQQYDSKLAKLREQAANGETRLALATAVQAYGIAVDPQQLLADADVVKLVALAHSQAAEFERQGQWLKALSLYRGLELLYENRDLYTDPLKRVARHVGLLRLYAPEELFALYVKEAEERGDKAPEPWNFQEDHWQTQLEGITRLMLFESLSLASRNHIEGSNYENLLEGALDGLGLMFKTPGLEKTFPNLADREKVTAFTDYLASVRDGLSKRTERLDYPEVIQLVARLIQRNESTVNLPEAVVLHELGEGATSTLDDFTSIIWPHNKARFERTTRGEFSGVGIQISLVNRELTVVTPLEGTPAHAAGIRAGDKVLYIDGRSTLGIDLDQAVDKITGEEGTAVVLNVKSEGSDQPRDIRLVRTKIKIESIKGWQRPASGAGWDYTIDPALNIAYVRMTTFGPNTADELDAAVQQVAAAGPIGGLILDLRFNPGGRLDAAVDVANRFLAKGVIVSTDQKTILGQTWTATAHAGDTYEPQFPVVTLINKGSASASEIVSGALQDHSRSLILGERSFGKGSVQNLLRVGGDKAYLKLTTQYYKLPDGRIIHRRPKAETWGIEPDVHVKMTDEQVGNVIKARMLLDIVRDPNVAFDPQAILNDAEEENAEQDPNAPAKPDIAKLVDSAQDILDLGMDPQLETALLLLKTRLLGDSRLGQQAAGN